MKSENTQINPYFISQQNKEFLNQQYHHGDEIRARQAGVKMNIATSREDREKYFRY
jgi:hypothetical protein